MNILMISREPNSYNNDLYNEFESNGITIDVIHLVARSNNNAVWLEQFERKYSHVIIPSILKQTMVLPRKILNNYSAIIISGWATPGCVIAIFYCLVFRKKFFIWTDTVTESYPKNLSVRFLRTPVRYLAITKSCAILTTGRLGRSSIEKLGCHPDKIIDFPYTVDQDRLLSNAALVTTLTKDIMEKSNNRPIAFYAGQLIFRKGLDILLRAIKSIVDVGIEIYLVIEGDGPLRKKYEAMVLKLGLENNVCFVGFNQNVDHASLLGLSDIVVVPSRWDPWGNLVHEAMILGKTVIASTGVCSAQDRIKNGVNGFLYAPEDVYDLTKIICKCISKPDLMESIRDEARATAVTWPADRSLTALRLMIDGS